MTTTKEDLNSIQEGMKKDLRSEVKGVLTEFSDEHKKNELEELGSWGRFQRKRPGWTGFGISVGATGLVMTGVAGVKYISRRFFGNTSEPVLEAAIGRTGGNRTMGQHRR